MGQPNMDFVFWLLEVILAAIILLVEGILKVLWDFFAF